MYKKKKEAESKSIVNTELQAIERELEKFYKQNKLNEINLYLYGLVLKQQEKLIQAKEIFLKVLNKFPCFWSAWLELCKIIENEDIVIFSNIIVNYKILK